ncbi:hypothetical protein AUR04nite_26780 [Glutamicibacter uratoxydans]|uniref:Uncharacterized protein n=1 Tax=Glutamicibacter uratoxydans TaxID=43667 RepID=A0A4Y4DQD4_GLUUR|nr:hypothetical protein [Glutamicibacter uratoxydans]GED07146.1 hypothetical protein AUR04nite_26780 [Glutamicibacter uratoxydans]
MGEKQGKDGIFSTAGSVIIVVLLLLVILLLISLPLVAGIGTTIWIFGSEAVRDSLGAWLIPWAAGSLVATFIVTEIVEAKLKKHSSAGKFTIEAASYTASLGVMALCYSGFFVSWKLSMIAALFSHAVMIPLYLLLAKLPDPQKKRPAAADED